MGNRGQSLVEFLIIVAVVAIGGIMALTLLGGNINEMFSSSNQKVTDFKPFGEPTTVSSSTASTTTSSTSSSSTTTSSSTTSSSSTTTSSPTTTVNGVDVNINTDGSANFTYNGQDVLISATMMDDFNTVFGSTGSDGLQVEVMAAVQKLIDDHKAEYSPADVPVEIAFGSGHRNESLGAFTGEATYNQIFTSVGDHSILIQKDQIQPSEITDPLMTHSIEKIGNKATISGPSHLDGETLTFTDFQNSNFDNPSAGGNWVFSPGPNPPESIVVVK